MDVLSWFKSLYAERLPRGETHDFTDPIWGYSITMFKFVDDGTRIFMVGHGYGLKRGDFICFRDKDRKRLTINVEQIVYHGETWKLYANVVQLPQQGIGFGHAHRPQKTRDRPVVRRTATAEEIQAEISRVTKRRATSADEGHPGRRQDGAKAAPSSHPPASSISAKWTSSNAGQEDTSPGEGQDEASGSEAV